MYGLFFFNYYCFTHIYERIYKYNLLSPFSDAHMYVVLELGIEKPARGEDYFFHFQQTLVPCSSSSMGGPLRDFLLPCWLDIALFFFFRVVFGKPYCFEFMSKTALSYTHDQIAQQMWFCVSSSLFTPLSLMASELEVWWCCIYVSGKVSTP